MSKAQGKLDFSVHHPFNTILPNVLVERLVFQRTDSVVAGFF